MELGYIPPQAIDIEQAVLGAIMIDSGAFILAEVILSVDCFYDLKNKHIYSAIQTLDREHSKIDMLTVINQLKKDGNLEVVSVPYISKLTSSVTDTLNIEYHAKIVYEKYVSREVIRVCSLAVKKAYHEEEDPFDVMSEVEKSLMDVGNGSFNGNIQETKDIIDEYIAELNRPEIGMTGLPTGFFMIDKFTGGLHAPDFMVLAARPAMGKTALAVNIAKNVASNGGSVAFFSLEMSSLQLIGRMFSDETGIDSVALKKRELSTYDWEKIGNAQDELKRLKFTIDDTASLKLNDLRNKCIRLKANKGLDFVVIDYIQLMRLNYKVGSREQEISEISRGLKDLAKELNVPILALSQLSRKCEERADKKPMLSDLRESGAIEQDADMVIALMRPEYYGFETYIHDGTTVDAEGLAVFEFLKHRAGSTGDLLLKFEAKNVKFSDYR